MDNKYNGYQQQAGSQVDVVPVEQITAEWFFEYVHEIIASNHFLYLSYL